MLKRRDIENLLYLRMSDSEIREYLLGLTPECIDRETVRLFVELLRSTLSEADAGLADAIECDTIDCSGTGGSGLVHFNTSTTAAFVLASAGLNVAKFGNRAATSTSGSFDFLGALGFPLGLPIEAIPELIHDHGLVFLFAPQFYPSLARFASVRRALDVKTIFNFLGPLLNPTRPVFRVTGVADGKMAKVIADYLAGANEVVRGLVVHAHSGLDEIDACGESDIITVELGQVRHEQFRPASAIVLPEQLAEHNGDESEAALQAPLSVEANVEIFNLLIAGEDTRSRYYHMVCLNAGAGLYAAGLSSSIDEGYSRSVELLASGAVRDKFEECRKAYARYLE